MSSSGLTSVDVTFQVYLCFLNAAEEDMKQDLSKTLIHDRYFSISYYIFLELLSTGTENHNEHEYFMNIWLENKNFL